MSIINGYGFLNGLKFCFGGNPKMPAQQAAPVVAPAPTVLPTEVGASGTSEADRRKKVNMLRMGLSSTIKTPLGPALTPANPTGRQTLG